jgi:glutathione S-transferase
LKLIGSLTSPFVRKVRIFALEKMIPLELVCDDVWSESSSIKKIYPLGKIPCLILNEGGVIVDSRTIIDYLDSLSFDNSLIPNNPLERAQVKTWESITDGLLDAAILARREVIFRPPEKQSFDWINWQMNKVEATLSHMSNNLGSQKWCHQDHFSLADIALGTTLDWLVYRYENLDWQSKYINLDKFLNRASLRPSFQATAPKE